MTWSSAITTYVDNKEVFVRQLRGLFASWFTTRPTGVASSGSIDLVAFAHAPALAALQADAVLGRHCAVHRPGTPHDATSNCWLVESRFNLTTSFGASAAQYTFINVVQYVVDDAAAMLERYSFVLRTDCDTFVTPEFARWRPTQFHTGRGRYAELEFTRRNLAAWAARLGVRHRGMHDLGASWYGPPSDVRRASALAARLTAELYERAFDNKQNESGWPRWHYGVALLYAQELAINDLISDVHVTDRMDAPSDEERSINDVVLLHSHQTHHFFSKSEFARHSYDGLETSLWTTTDVRFWALEMSWRGNGLNNRSLTDYVLTFPDQQSSAPLFNSLLLNPIGRAAGYCRTNFTCDAPSFCVKSLVLCVAPPASAATSQSADALDMQLLQVGIVLLCVVLVLLARLFQRRKKFKFERAC